MNSQFFSMRSATVLGLALGLALSASAALSADLNTVRIDFDRQVAAWTNMPRAEAPVTVLQVTDASLHRNGTESAYATQLTTVAKPVATNVPGLQPYGQDSVYAVRFFQNVPASDSKRKVDAPAAKPYGG
jgi:hypothetical protein